MKRSLYAGLGVLVLAAGCTGKVLTVGSGAAEQSTGTGKDGGASTSASSSSGGGGGSGGGSGASGTSVVWTGYFESFAFPSAPDVITMTIATASNGAVTGTILFGGLPVIAPPTDPNIGYPPALESAGHSASASFPLDAQNFEYTIQDGTLDGTRLQFSIQLGEVWAQWCALQTPIARYGTESDADGGLLDDGGLALYGYGCTPNDGFSNGENGCTLGPVGGTPIDCGKLALCEEDQVCRCTATQCSVPPVPSGGVPSFDMQVNGNAIDGAFVGFGSTQLTAHFTRGT